MSLLSFSVYADGAIKKVRIRVLERGVTLTLGGEGSSISNLK